jgi:CheY-like chemotaxis protein
MNPAAPSTATPAAPAAATRQVLLVDDDRLFLEATAELLQAHHAQWRIHTAASTAQALAILRDHAIDLLVLDIQMPVVDGLQLLRLIERKYPELRKAVITGYADEARRGECFEHGAELFLEKPHNRDGWDSLAAALGELAALGPGGGFQGVLRQAGLADILQLECLGNRSSVLEVADARNRGRIHVEAGQIVHAVCGTLTGEVALHHLLALRTGTFNLRPFEPPPERTLNGQWEFLLMEAARVRDEAGAVAPAPDGTDRPLAPGELAGAAGDEPAAPPRLTADAKIEEVLLCSGRGTVLHEAGCRNIDARLRQLKQVARAAEKVSNIAGLGQLLRCDLHSTAHRTIIEARADRLLLVRVSRAPGTGGAR